jgi:hypothetical protein
MAQYITLSGGQYTIWINTNTGLKVRIGQRNNNYVVDKELTTNGFSGSENTNWINIGGSPFEISGLLLRLGVRSGYWIIDAELDGTGFAGTENINWVNISGLN